MVVHPNVDKQSFIRWKQRDIHEKREQLKFRMKQLEVNREMNQDLLSMVDALLKASQSESISTDIRASVLLATSGTDKTQPALVGEDETAPKYADMIESLLFQIKAEIDPSKGDEEAQTVEKLKEHRGRIVDALEVEKKEYEKLADERSKHILSEDIHTGFDSTMINKNASTSESAAASYSNSTTQKETIEVLNSPSSGSSSKSENVDSEDVNPDIEASADAVQFSKIPVGDYHGAEAFLRSHPQIISEKDKDGLMMQAFDEQLAGDSTSMERTVHNALMLQYAATIGRAATEKLFERLSNPLHPASQAFLKDVQQTVEHIKKRCKIIEEERSDTLEQGGAEQIQLHAVDPDTEISIRVPEKGDEGYEIYEQFSPELKKAIDSKSLDEINKYLGDLSIEDAENLIGQFDQCGVLMIEEKIYDAEQWQAKKQELEQNSSAPQKSAAEVLVDDVD